MPRAGPTLSDMLATVDPLLTSCLPSGEGQMQAMRVLRLVNKELAVTAVKATTRCSLHLGENARVKPGKMIQLMTGVFNLESLTITFVTTSGRPYGPPLKQQMVTCTAHWQELLYGMRSVIRSVKLLTLRATFALLGGKVCMKQIRRRPDSRPCIPGAHDILTGTVCAMIAPAVPLLQDLRIQGCFENAAFPVFGVSCPQLTRLQVDAIDFPFKALGLVGTHLTRLACVTLKTPDSRLYGRWLEGYVGGSLKALFTSTSLTKMVLDFHPKIELACRTNQWPRVPINLRVFEAKCSIWNLHHSPALLTNLHTLSLGLESHHAGLLHITYMLRKAINLQQLFIVGEQRLKLEASMLGDVAEFKLQLARGVHYIAPFIRLRGTSTTVMSFLGVLPVLPSVQNCTLELTDYHANDLMAQVHQVFPNLVELHVKDDAPPDTSSAGLRTEQLQALTACDLLRRLRIRARTSLTTQAIVDLCQSMPDLEVIGFIKSVDIDVQKLWSALDEQGHAMEVEEYITGDCGKEVF